MYFSPWYVLLALSILSSLNSRNAKTDMWTNMTPIYMCAFTHFMERLDRNCFRHNTVYLRIFWLYCTIELRLLNIVFNFSFLQSLLMCLRESHRTRTVFRKVGGFVYVMSVLVSMEGCLRGEPVSPWNEIPVSQVLNLLHMVFNTVTVAMRFEPANAKFFHQEVSVALFLKWKHKQLNPQPRFFVQGFQNVVSFCRLILVASFLNTGLLLYYNLGLIHVELYWNIYLYIMNGSTDYIPTSCQCPGISCWVQLWVIWVVHARW